MRLPTFRLGALLLFTALARTSPAAAATPPADAPAADAPTTAVEVDNVRGIFVSDAYRFPRYAFIPGIVLRTLMDVVAIPSTVPSWSLGDWAIFGGVVASTVVLSIPIKGRSLDVRFRDSVVDEADAAHARVWGHFGALMIWTSLTAITASTYFLGLITNDQDYIETASLMVEAAMVTLLYHLTIKFFTGRQGPQDGEGLGIYEGPPGFLKYFPSGTPSGHVADMVALISVIINYWQQPVLSVVLFTVAAVLSVAIVADNVHYLSEAMLGAAIGWTVGAWVVHHRSSRYRNGADGKTHPILDAITGKITVAPMALPGGGWGAAAGLTF